jgi:hypothetical protein
MTSNLSRRAALTLLAGAAFIPTVAQTAERPRIVVHKDPNCGCCMGWADHLERAGFSVTRIDTPELDAVKKRLGVPYDLASCHTAEIDGYVIEGHVPAAAIKRLLSEKPTARGLAVPGMPAGSPGMDGPPETYEVVLFGPQGRRTFARYTGDREV